HGHELRAATLPRDDGERGGPGGAGGSHADRLAGPRHSRGADPEGPGGGAAGAPRDRVVGGKREAMRVEQVRGSLVAARRDVHVPLVDSTGRLLARSAAP